MGRAVLMFDIDENGHATPVPFDELPPEGEPLIPLNVFERARWQKTYDALIRRGLSPDHANYFACQAVARAVH